jgi:hypothetical protein
MNFKTLSVIAALLLVASAAFAVNPVTVDGAGGGDYTTIMAAIADFAVGGANNGEAAPHIINVVAAGGPYDEAFDINEATIALDKELILQSSVAGTLVDIRCQDVSGDGFRVHQSNADISFIDLLIHPSVTGTPMTDDVVKLDEEGSAQPSALNTLTFTRCIITDSDAAGDPCVSSKADAIAGTNLLAPNGNRTNGFASLFQHWCDSGESLNTVVDECVIWDNTADGATDGNHIRVTLVGDAGESFTVNNTIMGGGSGGGAIVRAGNASHTGTITFTGTDVTEGLDACTAFLDPPAEWHCITFEGGTGGHAVSFDNCLFDGGSGASRGISAGGNYDLTLSDLIINVSGIGIVDIPNNDATYDNLTVNTETNAILLVAGGTGSLTVRDSIFSGPGTKLGEASPTGGVDVDYCAFVESGPDAITARDDGAITVTYGSNLVTADPQYASKDATSADYFDVTNTTDYLGQSSAGGMLRGGASDITANWLSVGDIPDVAMAPNSTSAVIDLDIYVDSPLYTDDQITWSFSGNTDITVIQDSTSDPQTVAFASTSEVTETITATASDPDITLPDDSDDIIVRSANLTVNGSPDELVIASGECITCIIDLDDWIEISASPAADITWTYTGNSDILVEIADISASQPAHVRLELPTGATVGEDVPSSVDEVITFEGTDPLTSASDSDDLTMKKVKNYLDNTNYDFEWNGMVVNTAPIGWTASSIFYGGTSNTVTFGTSEDSYCGSFAGRINVSGLEGGDGATVAGLVSDEAIAYGNSEPLQVGDTIALGMNVKRSQDQWFRIVFFRLGFGHFHLENLAATNIGPGSPTGWEKYVLYFTLPGPAGSFYWRIDNIAIDAQLATGDVELLVDNITLVNYGAETLEDTKVTGAPIGITNKYFNMGTDTETTVVGVGTGTAEWSSTDMPVGWNIATAIDAYQHVDTGYPQYSVVDASSFINVDATNPQAAQLVSKAIDTSLPAGPAMTINVAINDGTNAADPVDERSERHVLTFNYGSDAAAPEDSCLFRAFVIAEDFSRSAEINVNSNYYALVQDRFRPFACHFAPQPWWPPSMIVPSAGVGNVIVRFDNISLLIGNVLTAAETTIMIDSAVMNVVQ